MAELKEVPLDSDVRFCIRAGLLQFRLACKPLAMPTLQGALAYESCTGIRALPLPARLVAIVMDAYWTQIDPTI